MINKNVPGQRVDVGRIDLLPSYSLFDVAKNDARRLVQSLKGADFLGKRLYCEIAEPDKDYARASARKAREAASAPSDGNYDIFINKHGKQSKKGSRYKKF